MMLKKLRPRWLRGVIAIALVMTAAAVSLQIIQWASQPWTFSLFGPSLTRSWNGELSLGPNDRRYVYLQLGHENPFNCRISCDSEIKVDALMCDQTGRVQDYYGGGKTRNWRGTSFYLDLAIGNRPAPGRVLDPGRIEGEWHSDILKLRARAQLKPVEPDGSVPSTLTTVNGRDVTPVAPERTWQMRPGSRDDFARQCSTLR